MSETYKDPETLADPFESLSPGEYGVDVVIDRADITDHFPNEILQVERCHVDNNRQLRRVSDDSFVRRILTDDGLLGSLPPEVDQRDEKISVLWEGNIPPSFVRLETPRAETVVSKVMALDTDISKFDLLVQLGHLAQQDDFTDGDLQTMEQALDTLAQLDNTDGLDRFIEQQFF